MPILDDCKSTDLVVGHHLGDPLLAELLLLQHEGLRFGLAHRGDGSGGDGFSGVGVLDLRLVGRLGLLGRLLRHLLAQHGSEQ